MSTSLDKYVQELVLNVRTNHPVTVVYTDDPSETVALTKDAVSTIRANTDKIFYWSSRLGWTDISDREATFASQLGNPTQVSVPEKLKKTPLTFCFGSPEEIKAFRPIFIMSLLSIQFKKDVMAVLQELRDFDYMVRNKQNNTYRLIIIANKSFEIPADYDNIFGVVNHSLPTRDELRTMYKTVFLEDYIGKTLMSCYSGDFDSIAKEFAGLEDYAVNTLSGLTERQATITLLKGVSANANKKGTAVTKIDLEGFKSYLYEYKFKEITKTGILNLLKPIPMEDVGGLENLKDWLYERKKAFSPLAKERGIKSPKGMALVGPPGTGKSYLAKSVAGLLDFPCVQLNLSSVFNKYVGESEANLDACMAQVEALAPAVVFIDEIDKVFAGGGAGGGDSGVTARVFGKLLTWLQETKSDLFFVVTANRVQNIPAEMLRKGRFDEVWCVTFPTPMERREILNIHLKKKGYKNINIDDVVLKTENFSSAELEHIVCEAVLKAFVNNETLGSKHLLAEVNATNPIALAFKEDIAYMKEWADKHARKASKPEEFKLLKEDVDI